MGVKLKRIKIDRVKLQRYFKWFASSLVSLLPSIALLALMSGLALSADFRLSNNIFQFKLLGDYIISGLLLVVSILLNVLLFIKFKRGNLWQVILLIFGESLFFSSLIPLGILHHISGKVTPQAVEKVINNTFIFSWVTIAFLLVGFAVTLFKARKRIAQSNWWLFAIVFPYIIASWVIQSDYRELKALTEASNFSYELFAEMLQYGDVNLLWLNQMWFKAIAGITVVVILVLGAIISENIWKKTKGWRK